MYSRLFSYVKSIFLASPPRTYCMVALIRRSPNFSRKMIDVNQNPPTKEELRFREKTVVEVLEKYKHVNQVYPNKNIGEIISTLAQNRFFSFIIDEKYGGTKFSFNVSGLARVLTKLTSSNPALGIMVMVPNSLGPAELSMELKSSVKNIYPNWHVVH